MTKRIIAMIAASISCMIMLAQDVSLFKVLSDSLFLTNDAYASGNKYQRDAMLFVDMLADTHPYYIRKERVIRAKYRCPLCIHLFWDDQRNPTLTIL